LGRTSTVGQGRPYHNTARQRDGLRQTPQQSLQQRERDRRQQTTVPLSRRETGLLPGVRAGRNVPPEARAMLAQRGAKEDRSLAGAVLFNRALANRPLRNPADRALAVSTFHGRFGDQTGPWHRRHQRSLVIGWVGPLFWP
jgi:hypothetical protein